jgi:hypothetical protein
MKVYAPKGKRMEENSVLGVQVQIQLETSITTTTGRWVFIPNELA